jgi:hypothetical protein
MSGLVLGCQEGSARRAWSPVSGSTPAAAVAKAAATPTRGDRPRQPYMRARLSASVHKAPRARASALFMLQLRRVTSLGSPFS